MVTIVINPKRKPEIPTNEFFFQVYEILDNRVIPWVVLVDGDGRTTKGFKSEWATIRGDILYVGSMGKEWTTPGGQFESVDPMWIKLINLHGEVCNNLYMQ